MFLTDDEFEELQNMEFSQNDWLWFYTQAVENKLLEKLKAQEPDKWTPAGFCDDGEPLYRHPLPPDDVVRDAERLEWLMNSGRIVICDRDGCYTYTHTSGRYGPVAKTQREAIDAAMEEMK